MTQEEQKQVAVYTYKSEQQKKKEQEILEDEVSKLRHLATLKEHFEYWKNMFPSIEICEERSCYVLCGMDFTFSYFPFWGKYETHTIVNRSPIWPFKNNYVRSVSDLGEIFCNEKIGGSETITLNIPKGFTSNEIENLVNSLARNE